LNEIIPGEVVVRFSPSFAGGLRPETASAAVAAIPALANARLVNRIAGSGWTLWALPTVADPRAVSQAINRAGVGVYAEPVNRVYPLIGTPNDGDYGVYETDPDLYITIDEDEPDYFLRLWHLDDVNAMSAWGVYPNAWYTASTKPLGGPIIAFVDTGCDMAHPDFINAGGTGTDISQGGQLDWSHSCQFHLGVIDPSGTPVDAHGHGTHVTGLAVAAGNNGSFDSHGVIGLGYNATAWVLRVFDDNGVGTDADAAAAIYYAADNGAEIINLSLGDTNYSQLFQDAVTYAFQKGSLVIAAGNENGNGGGNLGPIYPAACSGAIAVSANGPGWQPATDTYSGYGAYVDVAAPGGDVVFTSDFDYQIQFVWSTAMETSGTLNQDSELFPPYDLDYAYLAGTSMATPIVSGSVALYYGYKSLHQADGWVNVRAARALEKSAMDIMGAPYGGWEEYQGYGSLDAQGLLNDADARSATVGSIKGILYYNETPLANVQLTAQVPGGTVYSTTTLSDGSYRFEALPPGVYTVKAVPFGALKTKLVQVLAGSDAIGTDFRCGTYTSDTTPPVVPIFQFVGQPTSSGVTIRHWAYDPETSIDSMTFRIGTTVGGEDVLGDQPEFYDSQTVKLTGLSLQPHTAYYVQATYVNGGGLSTVIDRGFSIDAHAVAGTVALQDYSGDTTKVPVTVELRTPGSTVPLETYTVYLDSSGRFSIDTQLIGSFDVAVKAPHWLRKRFQSVAITTSGASLSAASLINGDVNGDNTINLADLVAMSRAWRSKPGDSNYNAAADLNGDGSINLADWMIAAKNWRMQGDP
jgi:subtilisin family serine protease